MVPDGRMRGQRGATAVEFAVAAMLFFGLVIGVIEFARMMYLWNAGAEATRLGARLAAVCDKDAAKVKARMRQMLPILTDSNITVTYPAEECTALNCDPVTVTISNVTLRMMIPLAPLSVPMPSFTTSIPSESLKSAWNPNCN